MNNIESIQKLTEMVTLLSQTLEKNQNLHATPASPSAQVILSIVPISGIVFGFVLLFFYMLWQYRIKKELIRSEKYMPVKWGLHLRTLSLLVGIMSTLVGLPMSVLFLKLEGISYIVLGGLIPFFAGLGLLIFYGVSRNRE